MLIRKWDKLPCNMQTASVRKYYDILRKKQAELLMKRLFDLLISVIVLVILSPFLMVLGIIVKTDSRGPVIYRQTRVTRYGKKFTIFKFRTMVENAEHLGTQVTVENDQRVTAIGHLLRKYRLDELPQLLNIFIGNMTFVGTRPEVVKYVEMYSDEMMATLLLPAGVTSLASILYKDEEKLLSDAENVDEIYINKILPEKMKFNLYSIENFGFLSEMKIMMKTVIAVIKKDKY